MPGDSGCPHQQHELLATLNPEQRAAVVHAGGPLLVLAGAGSGKTRVITHRIAYLIACRGVDPSRICALTFTNKAAREMAERVGRLVDRAAGAAVTTGTFHSFGARLLRRLAPLVERTPAFTIYDGDDQSRLIRSLLPALGLAPAQVSVAEIRTWIDRLKGSGRSATPEYVLGRPIPDLGPELTRQLYERYEEELKRADAFDFGDLILRVAEALEANPDRARMLRRRYQHLLVDEYQDTNPAQDRLINVLASPEGELVVVGDDDQAIYGWRGACADNILLFPERKPGCTVVRLERNYRSVPPILEAANAIIVEGHRRLGKELRPVRSGGAPVEVVGLKDDRQEAREVVRLAREHLEAGGDLGQLAVFYRMTSLSRRIEDALVSAGIPYQVLAGLRFYDRAEVKDLLAWARMLLNPRDGVAARRAMKSPRRGIGDTTLGRLQVLVEEQRLGWLEAAAQLAAGSGRTARSLRAFVELALNLQREIENEGPAHALDRIMRTSGLYDSLASQDDSEARDRLANLRELLMAAAELELRDPEVDLGGFLEQAALVSEADAPAPEGRLSLLTLHAAKGLEFPFVIMIGLEEGTLPLLRNDGDLEEERRLCYVGMTRAQERLVLLWSGIRTRFGDTQVYEPSRFLLELPSTVLARRVEPDPAELYGFGGRARRAGGAAASTQRRSARAKKREAPPVEEQPAFHPDPFPDYEGQQGPPAGHEPHVESYDEADEWPAPGDLVGHEVFGEGEVVEVRGRGPKATVSVRFAVRGVKRVRRQYLRRK